MRKSGSPAFKRTSAIPAVVLVLLSFRPGVASGAEIKPELFGGLKYRHIGPVGNRLTAVAGVPGEPNISFVGAASGGIFKTVDGGVNWKPVFDGQDVSSIGSLAIAPSDPNIVWAGTGEAFIRSNVSQGNGIYKSTDGGKTWKRLGLDNTGRIARIVIAPRNAEIVFAAAMGHCYGPQQERGVYRTLDGGKSWDRVLFVDENTGCSDIAMDPNNPRVLFAGMWPMLIKTWGKWSGGPGGGLFKSVDGGTTWTKLKGQGLPEGDIGKVGVAVAAKDSNRVYALIETKDEGLWRSDDGGETWKLINRDHAILNRPLYYTRCVVAPDNANEIYFPATGFHMSLDGGETLRRFRVWGGDNHDMWIDPLDPRRMMVGNDQGLALSSDRGKSWRGIELPIAQMYHVYVDNRVPYYVYGNRQDGTSYRGPSNSRMERAGIPRGLWHPIGGFESGFAVPDPVDNDIVWSGNYDGLLDRFDLKTLQSRGVTVWPETISGHAGNDAKYRFQWTFPIAISPHDHNRVYVGSQFVHMTTDGGQSWTIISPDLSTNDKTKQERTGGITQDDANPLICCCIFALAESPLEAGLIWAGTNDGLIQQTRDGGKNWVNVTKNIPNLPPWGTVSNIEPSRYGAGTCYITMDFHQVNDRDPYVYKTNDYGKTWKLITAGIPKSPLSYAHCVREDPGRKGLLYLGTENAVYVSFDDGEKWLPLQSNLPHAPAHWLTVQEHFSDLVVGTYGRGFWILDDIAPLRGISPEALASEVHLFAPRPAYRFRGIEGPSDSPNDPCRGENPPYGASLTYYLKEESKEAVTVSILDENGQTVRTLRQETKDEIEPAYYEDEEAKPFEVPRKAGLNRVWWDLRYDKTKMARLRTGASGHEHATVNPEGWRTFPGGSRMSGPLVPPGTYTVKLNSGKTELSQKLVVLKDPHSAGSEDDIRAQTKVLLEIHGNLNSAADLLNRIEWLRRQIQNLKQVLKGNTEAEPVVKTGEDLERKLADIEAFFFSLELTGSGDDLRWPEKLYGKLRTLADDIGKADFPPTAQQLEVHAMLTNQLRECAGRLDEFIARDLAAYNDLMKRMNIPNIVVTK